MSENSATYRGRQITWEIVDECIVIHDYQAGEAVNTVIPIRALTSRLPAQFIMGKDIVFPLATKSEPA
jgi:hypothetical protein